MIVEKRETTVIFSLTLETADNVYYNDNNNKSHITWIKGISEELYFLARLKSTIITKYNAIII